MRVEERGGGGWPRDWKPARRLESANQRVGERGAAVRARQEGLEDRVDLRQRHDASLDQRSHPTHLSLSALS